MSKEYKTVESIKNYVLFRFLKYNCKSENDFNGKEQYTLFEKLSSIEKKEYLRSVEFNKYEVPVTILKVSSDFWIIHTTENIIKKNNNSLSRISYKDIDQVIGFDLNQEENRKFVFKNGKRKLLIKTDGYMALFKIRHKNGSIISWELPTGNLGYTFWNFTMKLDYIKKFDIEEYRNQ